MQKLDTLNKNTTKTLNEKTLYLKGNAKELEMKFETMNFTFQKTYL